ncbi:MAG: radical SAM protein [Firmicutes bacterium]|nr:radical SAM protein [Bacillota bacterium]
MANGLVHSIERAAFSKILDRALVKSGEKSVQEAFGPLLDKVKSIMGDGWSDKAYENLQYIIDHPDSKWGRYVERIIKDTDPKVLKAFLMNVFFESGLTGYKQSKINKEKYGINMPWLILIDPTTACNMHCTGCWAAEYGNQLNLSFEELDSVVTQGEELGIRAYLFTGGEPLIRKKDIFRLCEKHPHVAFHAFTNGTLVDDEFCKECLRVGNFFVSVSIEGFEESNDGRRGEGHFKKALAAMDLMHSYKLPFGVSICYTSKNYLTVTSDEFLDMLVEKGCIFAWYFHYMPVGMNASTELLLSPEQREYMFHKIREIRDMEGGKELFAIDFQNDGEFVNGCVAGGEKYCHINANGDVEPCVFIHYSSANIKEKSLLECLQQPLFKAYRDGQPFNDNLLRPCPMLENPDKLLEIIKKTGAKSTDLEAVESAEHLCSKCYEYAENWKPMAEKLWAEEGHEA